jgi:hypothetical protein
MMKTIININHKELSKKQYPYNFNHKYLCCTNILLIIPLFIFLFNKHEIKDNLKAEYLLASLLTLTIVFSQFFWNNPIRYSNIHKIDGIIAKISISSFILYTIMYKFIFSYLFILLGTFVSFYFSNYYSSQKWCSNQHLIWHGILHIFCFVGTFYAFDFSK